MTNHGATLYEWNEWSVTLGLLPDLLPVVSNPEATISPHSSLREVGKSPSTYNNEGNVAGFPDWRNFVATPGNISEWSQNPDYGICVNARTLHAFDVDCDDQKWAKRVWEIIQPHGGLVRVRKNSPRFLVAFRPEQAFNARKLIDLGDGNKVEFYGLGKQFVVAGTHPSGARYEWLK